MYVYVKLLTIVYICLLNRGPQGRLDLSNCASSLNKVIIIIINYYYYYYIIIITLSNESDGISIDGYRSLLVGKPTMWFPNRSDTNLPVQLQKQARSLKFWS